MNEHCGEACVVNKAVPLQGEPGNRTLSRGASEPIKESDIQRQTRIVVIITNLIFSGFPQDLVSLEPVIFSHQSIVIHTAILHDILFNLYILLSVTLLGLYTVIIHVYYSIVFFQFHWQLIALLNISYLYCFFSLLDLYTAHLLYLLGLGIYNYLVIWYFEKKKIEKLGKNFCLQTSPFSLMAGNWIDSEIGATLLVPSLLLLNLIAACIHKHLHYHHLLDCT